MADTGATPPPPDGASRVRRWRPSLRRRALALGALLLVVAGVSVAVADFSSGGGNAARGATAGADPTSTATVTRRDLSEQTQEDATLGYAGEYAISLPTGTAASTLTQDQATVDGDERQVSADETALANAKALAKPTDASTLLADQATVKSDTTALTEARALLASDRRLDCPASSSATVSTPASGSSPSSGNSSGAASASSGGDSGSGSSGAGDSGNSGSSADSGNEIAHAASGDAADASSAGAPSATTGAVDNTTSTSTALTGTVNPDGADTTYYFQYGTGMNYGQTSPATDAGDGSGDLSVVALLTGLEPGQTYHYRLVATNADGTSYGQDATVQTTAEPTVTTGSGTTATRTSETLTGTVDPNGEDTSYTFEYGTTAALGSSTPVQSAGAGTDDDSITATATGLRPDTTYDFRLVATSALGTVVGQIQTFQTSESSCVAQAEVAGEDSQALKTAEYALTVDRLSGDSSVTSAKQTLSTDQQSLATAQQALSSDQADATNAGVTFTGLPTVGQTLHRGQAVYSLDGRPVPLFYGDATPYRALYEGVSPGPDVAELNRNLAALGFGSGIAGSDVFGAATESAVKAWQRSLGKPATGIVDLGDFVVEPGSIEVDSVTPTTGTAATAGSTLLTATSLTPVVTIDLDASLQSEVKVGDPVTVTLPSNKNVAGVISSVSNVAATSSSPGSGSDQGSGDSDDSGGSTTPTVTVLVKLKDPKAAGDLNQAPVTVSITSQQVKNALTVPVDALLALANGGYAIETTPGNHLIPVTLGLFDDAAGLVQISGKGLEVGQNVVVPNI